MGVMNFLRRHMQVVTALGATAAFTVSAAPQTLGLGKYRKIMASFHEGEEDEIPESIRDLTEKVLSRFTFSVDEEAGLDFFTCYMMDPVHLGCVTLRTGALVGIPRSFKFNTKEDVLASSLQVNNMDVDWQKPHAEALCQAMILSERGKAFAIAREVAYCSANAVWTEGFLKTGFTMLAYTTGFMTNNLFGFRSRLKLWARLLMYSAIAGVYFALYLQVHDIYLAFRDKKADRQAAGLGIAYAQGGVEYYSNVLTRNIALRTLLGGEGKHYYTPYGNVASSIRRNGIPYTERRDNLIVHLENYKSKQTDDKKNNLDT